MNLNEMVTNSTAKKVWDAGYDYGLPTVVALYAVESDSMIAIIAAGILAVIVWLSNKTDK